MVKLILYELRRLNVGRFTVWWVWMSAYSCQKILAGFLFEFVNVGLQWKVPREINIDLNCSNITLALRKYFWQVANPKIVYVIKYKS
jgi:hypothetical protein